MARALRIRPATMLERPWPQPAPSLAPKRSYSLRCAFGSLSTAFANNQRDVGSSCLGKIATAALALILRLDLYVNLARRGRKIFDERGTKPAFHFEAVAVIPIAVRFFAAPV
jgi:hypothetical protein